MELLRLREKKQRSIGAAASIGVTAKTLALGGTDGFTKYEKFADEIQQGWSQRNKEYHARLMLAICGPLTSGWFKNGRQYEVAERYALSALENADAIPVILELELTGHVATPTTEAKAPNGKEFAQKRRKAVEVWLHAWKRLTDACDPNWPPHGRLLGPNSVGADMGLPEGIAPENVRDPALRARYKAAIEQNRRDIERYTEQSRLHDWLKWFPKHLEGDMIQAYSKPPFDVAELKQCLDKYITDQTIRARILDTVKKNRDEEKKGGG